jgi:eukaryotic-like serine/threonine-protein kinase
LQQKLLLLILCVTMALAACSYAPPSQADSATNNNPHRGIDAKSLSGNNIDSWPMFGNNTGHTSFEARGVHASIVRGKLLWSKKIGPIFSSSAAGLGMLFIASTDGNLYAFKEDTGALVWRSALGNYLTDATPALEGRIVFVSVHSSALEALDAYSGKVYWTFETHEKIQAPPLVAGNRLLLASHTTLWALDATDGRLVWSFRHGESAWPSSGSPALVGDTIYIGLGTGTQIWALDLANGHSRWSFDTRDRITSTALAEADSVYVATWRGTIFALNRYNGQLRWSYSLNTIQSQNLIDGVGGSMALADGKLYVGDYRGSVLCIDAAKGQLTWQFATGAQVLSTPIVTAGFVYIGSGDGHFYALDTRTGRPAWRYTTGEVRSSASFAYNHVYIGSLTGMLYAFA